MAAPTTATADALARNVLKQRLNLRPKEKVLIEVWSSSLPWANAFVRQSRALGARPLLLYNDEASYWQGVEAGAAKELGLLPDHEQAALEETDAYIFFWGPEDRRRSRALPDNVQEDLAGFNSRWYDIATKTGLRGVRMEIARATDANARYYGVNLGAWREELVQSGLRDPAEFDRPERRVQSALEHGKSIRIRHANGTDLTLGLRGLPSRVFDGRVTAKTMKRPFGMLASVPNAAVVVALDESVADGSLISNRENYLSTGKVVEGAWTFSGGHLRGSRYAAGGARFRGPYATAGQGRDLPAILEIGLEPSLHIAPELEDSELGAITLGIGGNSAYGGRTKSGFSSWLTIRGAELSVDGRVLVKGGRIR